MTEGTIECLFCQSAPNITDCYTNRITCGDGEVNTVDPCTNTTLCPKSPSARGLVACLPVRLLFKSTKHNAFYPV